MSEKFLRIKDVMEMTGVSKSFIWNQISLGNFPKQIVITPKMSVWREAEIQEWMQQQIDKRSE